MPADGQARSGTAGGSPLRRPEKLVIVAGDIQAGILHTRGRPDVSGCSSRDEFPWFRFRLAADGAGRRI